MEYTSTIRTLLLEDDLKAREILKMMLGTIDPNIEIVGEADNVEESVQLISLLRPDLVFLDIELRGGTGFDVLEKLDEVNFEVIFSTGFDQYAIRAFRFSALHYLLKPVDEQQLLNAVERFRKVRASGEEAGNEQIGLLLENLRSGLDKKIAIRETSGIHFIKIRSILRCEAEGNYTRICLTDGRTLLSSKNLKEYEHILEGEQFFRVHHSHLINLALVEKYQGGRGGSLLLEDGTKVEVAVRKKEELLKRMSRF